MSPLRRRMIKIADHWLGLADQVEWLERQVPTAPQQAQLENEGESDN